VEVCSRPARPRLYSRFAAARPISSTDIFTYDVAKDGKALPGEPYVKPEHVAPLTILLQTTADNPSLRPETASGQFYPLSSEFAQGDCNPGARRANCRRNATQQSHEERKYQSTRQQRWSHTKRERKVRKRFASSLSRWSGR